MNEEDAHEPKVINTPKNRLREDKNMFTTREYLSRIINSKPFILTTFITPAMTIIFLFVYIPLILMLIVSLYWNPTSLDTFRENLIGYYTDSYNVNWVKIRDFSENLWNNEFFLLFGAVGIILGSVYGARITSFFGMKSDTKKVFTSMYFNILIAPFAVIITKLILLNLPPWLKLPLGNYNDVLTNEVLLDNFMRILFNTVFWTISCTFFHITLGMGLAVLLNQDFKGRGLLRTLFILPWAIPSFISALIWKNYIFNADKGVLGKWAKENIPVGSSYYFTIADLLASIGILLILLIFYSLVKKYYGSSPITAILGLVGFVVSSFLIVLVLQANTRTIPVLGTSIFSIQDTKTTFWFTSKFYFFNIEMRTIEIAAILTNIWLGVPFMMVSFLAALQAIPDDLYEAAEIDGATGFTQFTAITFPLIKPTLRTVALLGIIWTFNLFNVFYILSQNQNAIGRRMYYDIFITYIYYLIQNGIGGTPHFAYASALSFIVFLLLVGFSQAYNAIFPDEGLEVKEES